MLQMARIHIDGPPDHGIKGMTSRRKKEKEQFVAEDLVVLLRYTHKFCGIKLTRMNRIL